MKTIKRLAAATLAAAGLSVAVVGTADAAPIACVTRTEFRQVRRGMTPARVTRIFGTRGRIDLSSNIAGYRYISKDYRPCAGRYSIVSVNFSADPGEVLRVSGKFAYWSSL